MISTDTYRDRIRALMALGRLEIAGQLAAAWVADDVQSAEAHAFLAWVLLSSNQDVASEQHAATATQLKPEWDWPWRIQAGVRLRQKRADEALSLVDQAVVLAPETAGHHHFRAIVLRRLGRRDDAILAAQHAVELDPNEPEYRRWLLEADDSFQFSEAGVLNRHLEYKHLLALNPENAASLSDLAYFYKTKCGDSETAEALLRSALAIEPDNEKIRSQLGDLFRSRDLLYELQFHLILPFLLFLLGLLVFLKPQPFKEHLKFLLYVTLPTGLFGAYALVFHGPPAVLYCVLRAMVKWSPIYDRKPTLLALRIWCCRAIWLAGLFCWWYVLTLLVPVNLFTVLVIGAPGLVAVLLYQRWIRINQRDTAGKVKATEASGG